MTSTPNPYRPTHASDTYQPKHLRPAGGHWLDLDPSFDRPSWAPCSSCRPGERRFYPWCPAHRPAYYAAYYAHHRADA